MNGNRASIPVLVFAGAAIMITTGIMVGSSGHHPPHKPTPGAAHEVAPEHAEEQAPRFARDDSPLKIHEVRPDRLQLGSTIELSGTGFVVDPSPPPPGWVPPTKVTLEGYFRKSEELA